jgi:hypothetical protein
VSTTAIVGAALMLAAAARPWLGVPKPDTSHSFAVRFNGGTTLYFHRGVGWWLENGRLVFAGLVAAAVLVE